MKYQVNGTLYRINQRANTFTSSEKDFDTTDSFKKTLFLQKMGIPQFLKSSKNFKVKQNLQLLNNKSPKQYYNRPFVEKNDIKEGITRYNTSSSLGRFCKNLKKDNES